MTHEDQSLSVLIVEDDRDGRRLFVEWLEQAGFRVAQAHNGLQALERAVENTPDVVVTDLNIPGIDGFELTRRLKQDSRTRDVPVLAVTGYAAFTADPGRARRAGLRCGLGEALFSGGPRSSHQAFGRRRPADAPGLTCRSSSWSRTTPTRA